MPDKHIAAPSSVAPLTEQEKVKLIAIAQKSEEVAKYITGDYTIDFQWVVMNPSIVYSFSYNDVLEKGIPAYDPLVSQPITVYPAILFSSHNWIVSVAIDLQTEKIVYTSPFPNREGTLFGTPNSLQRPIPTQ